MTIEASAPLVDIFPVNVTAGINPEDYRQQILFGDRLLNNPGILNHNKSSLETLALQPREENG